MADEEPGKLDALRQEVRAWLKENLPEGWGSPGYVAPERGTKEAQELGKAWQKKLYDAGYTGFGIPTEYGGVERPREEVAVIRDELQRTGTPPPGGSLGPMIVIPTLLRYGNEEQKKRFIPKILSGEESWCECFSEPDAGSDLANIQKTGVRDGDEWVVNGQSVWTSGSKFADWGVVPVRTDINAPRHRNLSYFVFDCKSPGFEVRPLMQMTGDAEFSETFFDNVRIPHANMIGEEGQGWYVAMATLEAERGGGIQFVAPSRRIEPTTSCPSLRPKGCRVGSSAPPRTPGTRPDRRTSLCRDCRCSRSTGSPLRESSLSDSPTHPDRGPAARSAP